MVRRLYDPADARRLLNPGPVAIVSTVWRDITNAAPVIWTTSLSMEPPLVGCVIHPQRHTADMIRFSEEFVINIPGPSLLKHVAFLGSQSGLQNNKLESAGLELFRGLRVEAPLIEGCLAWIECGAEDVLRIGDHTLFVGRVEKVQALDEAYAGTWKLEDPDLSPLTYLGGNTYAVAGSPRDASFEVDEHGALISETPEEREQREEQEARDRELAESEGEEAATELRRQES